MTSFDIDLSPDELIIVQTLLRQHVPTHDVRAFGSRVTHTAKPFSDLDIVIIANEPLPLLALANLVEAFSNSSLPFKVDVLDWSRIDDDFRAIIKKKNILIHHPHT